jgi:hypothetical protein
MTPMSAADCCNLACVSRRTEPIVNRRADAAALDRRFAGAMVTGNQKEDSIALHNRPIERPVDCEPSAVEIEPMQIENLIRID